MSGPNETVQLAYLGMGSMGRAMSKNLVLNGKLEKPIILWNRTTFRAQEHSIKIGNSVVAESIAEAVSRSNIIWSCFSDQEAVIESFEVIFQNNIEGKLFLECSTITSEATNDLAQKVINAGGEFVAMPVFGEPTMAEAAMLTCLPAGRAESVKRILPFLNGVIGRSILDLSGELPGTASHLKVIGNVLIVQMIESVAEAHVLSEKSGLGADKLHKLISIFFPGPFAIYSKRMSEGGYYQDKPKVNIGMAKSVAAHVLELAEKSGTELKAYQVGVEHLDMVEKHVGIDGDISGIYGAVRLESGLKYENQK